MRILSIARPSTTPASARLQPRTGASSFIESAVASRRGRSGSATRRAPERSSVSYACGPRSSRASRSGASATSSRCGRIGIRPAVVGGEQRQRRSHRDPSRDSVVGVAPIVARGRGSASTGAAGGPRSGGGLAGDAAARVARSSARWSRGVRRPCSSPCGAWFASCSRSPSHGDGSRGARRRADRPGPRPRAVQLVLGPAQRDVQQPPFLGLRGVRRRPRDRHETALEAGHEHDRPLESLGAVERDEVDAGAALGSAPPPGRGVEPGRELGDAAGAADRLEVVAAELEQRVAMRARVVATPRARSADAIGPRRPALGVVVGGEVGEVVRERPAGQLALGVAELVEHGAHRRRVRRSAGRRRCGTARRAA